jgi:hypothetical protein
VNGLRAGFQHAKRFRFEAEVHGASGLLRNARDVLHAMPDVRADQARLIGRVKEFFE